MKKDSEIQKDVMDELKWEPLLKASEIGVAVKDGIVILSGNVDSYYEKLAAERAVKHVAGVKAVAEEIHVVLPTSLQRTDAQIAEAVLNAIKWNVAVPEETIKVKVENGWVTLSGTVNWEYQKDAAKVAIQNLSGLKGVTNLITVKASVLSKDVRQKIVAAFHRSATLDAQRIQVEIRGSSVILTGEVRSWAERDDAEKAAWNAQGVTDVENNLRIL